MWDFEHPPLLEDLMNRYTIESMLPSECADRLVAGTADVGLVPIAALATAPQLHVLPGCTIASKGKVRSLLLVRRTNQELKQLRSVAADTASRTTIAYARILFRKWANPGLEFVPLAADLDAMLERADAAIVIGDPALLALEERANRFERTGEELVYHDLADEWRKLTGLPFVSAIWATSSSATASNSLLDEGIANDLIRSRDHGLAHIEELAREWSRRIPVPEQTIRTYLSENIHYVLDEECIEGMRGFFREAAQAGILPQYEVDVT
jgi:chorismate dehydratase